MISTEFKTRLEALLSHLAKHLSDEQIDAAVVTAKEITGVSLPTTDPDKIEAIMNRGESLCLKMLQNDWLPRFDFKYGDESLSRGDVSRTIEKKLARLERRWEKLSERYKSDCERSISNVAVRTAHRP